MPDDGEEEKRGEDTDKLKHKLESNIGNVAIFRRMEEQEMAGTSNNQHFELNNINYWLYWLEDSITKITTPKISLFDLQNDEHCYHPLHENLNPINLTRF